MKEEKWGAGIPDYTGEDLMTEEDVHEFACRVVAGDLENSGYEIHAFNPVFGSYPSVIAENKEEVIAVIVNGAVSPKIPKLKLTDKLGIIGYSNGYPTKPCYASVSIGSIDSERFEKSLALKGDGYLVRYTGVEYIDKELPKADTDEYKLFVMQFIGGYLRAKNYDAVSKYITEDCVIDNSITKEKPEIPAIDYIKEIFQDCPVISHCIIKSVGNWKTLNVEKLYVKNHANGEPGTVKILQEPDKIGLLIVTETPAFDYDDNGIVFKVEFNKERIIEKIELIDPRLYEFKAYGGDDEDE